MIGMCLLQLEINPRSIVRKKESSVEPLSNRMEKMEQSLAEVLYVPGLMMNLFLITKAIENPSVMLGNEGKLMKLSFCRKKIIFDQEIETGKGRLLGVKFFPVENNIASITLAKETKSVQEMHEVLGHTHEKVVWSTATHLGIKLIGEFNNCKNCALGKAKQQNIAKINANKAEAKGERIYLDISSIKNKSFGGAKYWILLEDEAMHFCWSLFAKEKGELHEKVIPLIKKIQKELDLQIKIICCDNAGENKKLQEFIDKDGALKFIKLEFTVPYMLQQNGIVERRFATLFGRVQAMLNGARLPERLRTGLWVHVADTATNLHNIEVHEGITPYKEMYGALPKWSKNMCTFGEIAIVADGKNCEIQSKLDDQGLPGLFVGYPVDHASNVYKLFSINTEKIILSRNVIWIKKNYSKWKGIKEVNVQRVQVIKEIEEEDEPEQMTAHVGQSRKSNHNKLTTMMMMTKTSCNREKRRRYINLYLPYKKPIAR